MDDDRDDDLLGEAEEGLSAAFDQAGPDLFGFEPDELILPTEPVPTIDPDMDLPLDAMDEIPIDPDDADIDDGDAPADDAEVLAGAADAATADVDDPQPDAAASAPGPAANDPQPDAAASAQEPAPGKAEPQASAPTKKKPQRPAQEAAAPLALYRRYRPDTFAEVIGQEHVTEPLQRALVNNRVNHAYLFSGPRGCGKTTSARILARCLNCEQGPTPTPCGVCRSCVDLARGGPGSIDVIEMDAATHGLVEDARSLRERAFFSPVHSRFKIYIIDEAHMVTPQGFNALLKVVEEPPPHVKFIFATTEPEKVLGTIRSRTHHYPFRLVPPKTLSAYLAELCRIEGVSVDPAVLPLVVRAGAGSVRDSLSVLDQLLGAASAQGVGYAQATGLLGYTPDTLLDEIMDAFAAGDAQGVFACIDKIIEVGQDPRRFAEDLLRRLRDLIIVAAVPDALDTGLVDVSGDQGERLHVQANGMGAGELTRAAEVIAAGLTDMRGTTAPRLHLELMCARVLLPGADVDQRGVHARLDRLERRLQMAGVDEPTTGRTPRPSPPDAAPRDSAPGHRTSTPASVPDAAPRDPAHRTPTPVAVSDAAPRDRAAARRTPTPSGDPIPEPPGWLDEPPADHRPDARQGQNRPAAPSARPAPNAPGTGREATAPTAPRPAAEAPSRPAPNQPGNPQPTPSQPGDPQPASGHDPAQFGTSDLRAAWPQVLEAVKVRRRVTWIALQQNAQVHSLVGGELTLSVNNPGARDTLQRGGSSDIIREAILEVVGIAPTVTVVSDSDALAPGAGHVAPPRTPTGTSTASWEESGSVPRGESDSAQASAPTASAAPAASAQSSSLTAPAASAPTASAPTASTQSSTPTAPTQPTPAAAPAQRARQNIQAMQSRASAPEPEEEPDRDDIDIDDDDTHAPDVLLARVLGAELIGEEEPTT